MLRQWACRNLRSQQKSADLSCLLPIQNEGEQDGLLVLQNTLKINNTKAVV